MGVYDTFCDKECCIQLKSFGCELKSYKVGDGVSVKEYGFPKTCAFYSWSEKGFVVIRDEVLVAVIDSENVYDKYGDSLWDKKGEIEEEVEKCFKASELNSEAKVKKKEEKYFYANDFSIDRVVPHVKRGKYLVSLVTGRRQEFKDSEAKK